MGSNKRWGHPCLFAMLLVVACSGEPPRNSATLLEWLPPAIAGMREGGLSDLTRDPADTTGRTFFAINDRGPNDAKGGVAYFPLPAYHQKIFRFRLAADGVVRLLGTDSIRSPEGRWTTGLPSPFFPTSEQAVARGKDGQNLSLPPDSAGFDFEGLAADGEGGFWASEEYGPRIVHMRRDSAGLRIDKILSPGNGLPAVFARRAMNKGLEALCGTSGGHLVAMFQGALDNTTSNGSSDIAERSLARRILVLDPSRGSVREYMEQVDDDPKGKTSRRTKTGACTALDDNRILVLQHRKKGKGRIEVNVQLLDLSGATDVHLARDTGGRGRLVGGATLEEVALDPAGFARAGIRPVGRSLLRGDLTKAMPGTFSKPEGIVRLGDSTFLISFDNDFAIDAEAGTDVMSSRFLHFPLAIPER